MMAAHSTVPPVDSFTFSVRILQSFLNYQLDFDYLQIHISSLKCKNGLNTCGIHMGNLFLFNNKVSLG